MLPLFKNNKDIFVKKIVGYRVEKIVLSDFAILSKPKRKYISINDIGGSFGSGWG